MFGIVGKDDRVALRKLVRLLRDARFPDVRECLRFLVKADSETLLNCLREVEALGFYPSLLLARFVSVAGGRTFAFQIVDLMKDANPAVRWLATAILGEIGDPKLTPYLVEALDDSAVEVRLEAVNALRRLRDESAFQGLVKALRNSDPSVRVMAVRSLGLLRKEDAFPHLIAALRDECADVVYASLKTIGEVGLQEAIIHVVPLLDAEKSEIRAEARRVLESFAKKFGFSGNEAEWVELSVGALKGLEDFRRRLGKLEEALSKGDLKTADEYIVELDELADELKFQLVKAGGWCLEVFEKEEERLDRLAKEVDLLGAERAKALQGLGSVLRGLLETRGVVSLRDVPKASFRGHPVLRDEDVISVFEEMVKGGFRGVVDGDRLIALDVIERKINELAKVYSRIRVEKIAEKVGVSEELLIKILEESFSSGVLQGRIDDASKIVEFQTGARREKHIPVTFLDNLSPPDVNERI
ncbi:MAG: HEAT repeat domain-containing protein [Candidatus Freyarchaeota archaeon]|nr:HEAT repeat domain-containing protein [Candidatus Jordarchaeia archaeon]